MPSNRMAPTWTVVLAVLGATACSSSRSEQAEPAPLAAAPAPAVSAGDAGPADPEFPQADLRGLSAPQRELFTALATDEFCPCNCPVSLGACLGATARCPAATLEAAALLKEIRRGVSPEDLREMAAEEFAGGYSAPAKPIVLDGYASIGPAGAPITVVVYSDFECPHCRAAGPVLKDLPRRYPGEVRLVFKHFPLLGHPMAKDAALAVEAAGRQRKFWEMHDALFEHQMVLSQDTLRLLARQLGLDVKRFEQDLRDPGVAGRVEASRREAEALGINSTPTIYINGRRFGLRRTAEALDGRIAMERVRGQGTCPPKGP